MGLKKQLGQRDAFRTSMRAIEKERTRGSSALLRPAWATRRDLSQREPSTQRAHPNKDRFPTSRRGKLRV